MRLIPFGIAVAALLFAAPAVSSETFAKVIGVERVDAIVREVTKTVSEEQAPVYKRKVVAENTFIEVTSKRAGDVETTLDRLAAEWRLRGLYGVFLTHVIAYVQNREREGMITLTSRTVDSYMAYARELKLCGEIPCPNECKPCDKNCDRCP